MALFSSNDGSKWTYIKYGAAVLIIGISVSSFITQSILFIKDKIAGTAIPQTPLLAESPTKAADGANVAVAPHTDDASSTPQQGLGSDDAVYQDGSISSTNNGQSQYQLSNSTQFPRLTAGAFLAADLQSGEIILEQGEGRIAPIASVSKLMTALIAFQQMDLQKIAIVSRDSYNTFGTEGELVLGEKIKLNDLMYPLLMESSNDGAEVVAETYDKGRDAFMREMNKKAKELGMNDTYFEDPSGLNAKNVSSVEDLMKLGRYVWQKEPVIFDLTRARQYAILKHQWFNKNAFLKYDSFMGGKNGYIDESKKTTVSLFNTPMARGGNRQIVIVLLKSDDREGDAVKILNFLKKNALYSEAAQ